MKIDEKKKALTLRKKGESIRNIAKTLGVSKASVSIWVRDIVLSNEQKKTLTSNGFSVAAVEKRRVNRITNTQVRHNIIIDAAKKDINTLSRRELLLVGAAIYWGEGGKTKKAMATIANSDPHLIQFMMKFFNEICEVKPEKFRGQIHTHSHLSAVRAEKYWSSISGIPLKQFYKTYSKPSKASLNKRDRLPYGTFQIYVCDTKIFLSVMGWIEGLKKAIIAQ
jgi:predicted transcriptional regulator